MSLTGTNHVVMVIGHKLYCNVLQKSLYRFPGLCQMKLRTLEKNNVGGYNDIEIQLDVITRDNYGK